MSRQLDVIYENGVFRPLEPVDVPEHQRMTMTIPEASLMPAEEALFDTEDERWAATQVTKDVSLDAVRPVLSKISGALTADFLAERAEPEMPVYSFDSSALGKRDHPEVGSIHIETLFQTPQPPHFISRLSVVEFQSVLAWKVRRRAITAADLELLPARFLQDIAQRAVRVIRMSAVHDREAERLMQQYGVGRNLRTMDALQRSVALALHRRITLDAFVGADQSLCSVAEEERLNIINPELT